MRIYFGKISKNHNIDQIKHGFYAAPKGSSWFNGIEPGDYAYAIGGDKIQLWRAREWTNKDGSDQLDFDILIPDLEIVVRDLVEFKYFKLTTNLVVKTTRSTGGEKKAFFPIEFSDDFTEELLNNENTYLNRENQRGLYIYSDLSAVKKESYDIQFYFNNDELKFEAPLFSDPEIKNAFQDNLSYLSQGQPNKDKTLAIIKASDNHDQNLREKMTFIRLYDALFCKYKIKDRTTRYWVLNGNDQKQIDYCLQNSIYIMQYQYDDQSTSKVTYNLNRVKEMKPGDRVLLFNENTYYASGVLDEVSSHTEIIFSIETTLQSQINNRNQNDYESLVKYTDATCYFEDLREDNGFEGAWGQRLFVESWENVNEYGIKIPGVNSHTKQSRDTIFELDGDSFFNHVNSILSGEPEQKTVKEDIMESSQTEYLKIPKNRILFGPPGTGKTYDSIRKAVEICNADVSDREDRPEVKRVFEKLVNEGRIVFTTFHQSMTYEDFVEGIKPQEPAKEGDPLIYKIEKGIFSTLITRALYSIHRENEESQSQEILDFSSTYDLYLDSLDEQLGKDIEVSLPLKSGGKILIDGISEQRNLVVKHPSGMKTYTVSKSRLTKLHKGIGDLDKLSNISEQIRDVIGGCNASAYWAVLKEVRDLLTIQPQTTKDEAHSTVSLNEMEQINDSFEEKSLKGLAGLPHVLIIDEINRGNISEIFGELITLLEDDKRLGEDEELKVVLPYSKKSFGVPSNLYIVGTMNTADRSVEALDTALRRRFSFEEIIPDSSVIRKNVGERGLVDDYDIARILDSINKRIEMLLSPDHLIGHSYFLSIHSIEDLQWVFDNKIIPLLKEYFYGDLGKIGLVIGEGFFDLDVQDSGDDFFAPFAGYDTEDLMDKKLYFLKKNLSIDDFKTALNLLLNQ